jgi:phage baseplate assembly protein W
VPYLVVNPANVNENTPYGLGISTQNIFTSTYKTLDQTISDFKFLLLTMPGEIVGNPSFGTNLLRILFEPNNSFLKQDIDEEIRSAVSTYFGVGLIEITSIDVTTPEDDPQLTYDIVVKIQFNVNVVEVAAELVISATNTGTVIIQNNQIVGGN